MTDRDPDPTISDVPLNEERPEPEAPDDEQPEPQNDTVEG